MAWQRQPPWNRFSHCDEQKYYWWWPMVMVLLSQHQRRWGAIETRCMANSSGSIGAGKVSVGNHAWNLLEGSGNKAWLDWLLEEDPLPTETKDIKPKNTTHPKHPLKVSIMGQSNMARLMGQRRYLQFHVMMALEDTHIIAVVLITAANKIHEKEKWL